MNTTWYLLALILDASTGEPLEVKSLGEYTSPEACLVARDGKTYPVVDNKAVVTVCARQQPANEQTI